MSSSAHAGPTPSRLLRRRGRWALELTRLVPVDDKILEPRSQRVEGSDAILRHLRHAADHGVLAQGALHLMRALRGDDDRSFVVLDGEWVASNDGTRPRVELEWRMQLDEMRAEMLLLRASHQRLRDRVAALEARLEHVEPKARAVALSSRPPPPRSEPKALAEPIRPVAAPLPLEPEAAADRTQQSAGAAAPPPAPLNPFREVAEVLATPKAAPEKPLALPPPAQVTAALAELFGGDSGLSPADEPVPDSALELAALYAGRFVDDDGNDVGVLLAELRLVAHIGGKLMGLPTTVIDEQARTGILGDQVLLAMSEVVNTLSNTVSNVAGNAHVRGCPIEPFPPERLQWISGARQRISLARTRVGTLWLLSR